jgi:predicted component of type VI protein secretion system
MEPIRATDDTFCIAVLGDFLGEGSGSPQGDEVRWIPKRATPDTVVRLAGLRPRIRLGSSQGEQTEEVIFSSLQDFDPGELFLKLALLEPFRDARETIRAAPPISQGVAEAPEGLPEAAESGGGSLLDAIVAGSQPSAKAFEPGNPEEFRAFVKEVVRPHLVQENREEGTRVAAVDEAASLCLSGILHEGSLQQLEAIWRSLVFLLSRIDTTGKVKVYLVQAPKSSLEKDLAENGNPLQSRLFDLLSGPAPASRESRWALVLGAYPFQFAPSDIALLEQVARVAGATDLPWISAFELGSSPGRELEGRTDEDISPDPPSEWRSFRDRPESAWVGLTFPRFLLREPYGEDRRRKKTFDFRETVTSPTHYLWGLGPFLAGALLAEGFVTEGWGFRPGRHLEMDGVPVANLPGAKSPRPTSLEFALGIQGTRGLTELGLMPLIGFPERAGVRIGGIRSLSPMEDALAAWWRR